MTDSHIDEIANAILYEGYVLYPDRASTLKSRQRLDFGVVLPQSASAAGDGASELQTRCLVHVPGAADLTVRVRFLHAVTREGDAGDWDEAIERVVTIDAPVGAMHACAIDETFAWPRSNGDGWRQEPLEGEIAMSIAPVDAHADLFAITLRIVNRTIAEGEPSWSALSKRALLSTHALFQIDGGAFISLLDPPPDLADAAAACTNTGLWPVLVGDVGSNDAVLASPIVLDDYPQIADDSAGDFLDPPVIDDISSLRGLGLSDAEEAGIRAGDPRARRPLTRTEDRSPQTSAG